MQGSKPILDSFRNKSLPPKQAGDKGLLKSFHTNIIDRPTDGHTHMHAHYIKQKLQHEFLFVETKF